MVEVITDGAADLFPHTPKDVIKVPINVIWRDETIPFTGENREEIDKILKKARPGEVKTSQPSPKQILDALEGLEGDVIYVALSSKLSGTFSVARSVARIVKGRRINLHVVDSRSVSLGMGILVDLAIHLAEMGAKVEEVVKELETLREKIRIFFAVPTLDYLIAGGRIGIVKGIQLPGSQTHPQDRGGGGKGGEGCSGREALERDGKLGCQECLHGLWA